MPTLGNASSQAGGSGTRAFVSALKLPIVVLLVQQLMGGMILSPQRTFFPIYLRELGYPVLFISLLASVQQVMGLVASWVGGTLCDSLGRKKTLLLGQVGAVASGAAFLTGSAWLIAPLRALGGSCGGLHTVGAQSYLLDVAPSQYLGLFTAFYNWGYTLGGALGSPLAGFLLVRLDYGAFAVVLVLAGAATMALTQIGLPESPISRVRRERTGERWMGYRELIRRRPIVILALLRFLPTLYWGMCVVLVPLLLHSSGADKLAIAVYATVSQVFASLAQVVAGHSADRFGPRVPTLLVLSMLVASIIGIGISPHSSSALFAFGTLSTGAAWSMSTLMPSLVTKVTEASERGRVLGWVHLWWNLGMVVGSLVGGALVGWYAGAPFMLAGAANLGTIALAISFFKLGSGGAATLPGSEPTCLSV